MLEGKKYYKYMPLRALAVIFTVAILAASILAPFTYIVNGDHFVFRFDVEDIEKEYNVSYDGQIYTVDVTIPGDLYYSYADKSRIRADNGWMDYAAYVVIDDVVQDIADKLKVIADEIDNGSDYILASLILDFVHQTPYLADSNIDGVEVEYPKTPVETLVERGDCEDLSALYTSIALAAGLDAVMFMFPLTSNGHMAAGVHIEDSRDLNVYYTYEGIDYYFCETTSPSKHVGDVDSKYSSPQVMKIMEVLSNFPNA